MENHKATLRFIMISQDLYILNLMREYVDEQILTLEELEISSSVEKTINLLTDVKKLILGASIEAQQNQEFPVKTFDYWNGLLDFLSE